MPIQIKFVHEGHRVKVEVRSQDWKRSTTGSLHNATVL